MSGLRWAVFQQRRKRGSKAASVYGGGKPTEIEYQLSPEFGFHDSKSEAIKSLVLVHYPENKDSPEEHIKRMAKEFLSGSVGHYKIKKTAQSSPEV